MKILVWTHNDLDGAVSYLVLRWYMPKATIDCIPANPSRFREQFTGWLTNNKLADYDKVFITDLDISDLKDLIDHKNVIIIDHHTSHVRNNIYEHATSKVQECTSACKLIYRIFKETTGRDLTTPQKLLVSLADDYDSYTLSVPQSQELNIVFHKTNNKFKSFIETFFNGFTGFNKKQKNLITLYEQQMNIALDRMPIYTLDHKIEDRTYHFVGGMLDDIGFVNEAADHILETYNADVAIVVVTSAKHVSFRKRKDLDELDMSVIAKNLCDGGGHSYAAGGKITENFMLFTKAMDQIK